MEDKIEDDVYLVVTVDPDLVQSVDIGSQLGLPGLELLDDGAGAAQHGVDHLEQPRRALGLLEVLATRRHGRLPHLAEVLLVVDELLPELVQDLVLRHVLAALLLGDRLDGGGQGFQVLAGQLLLKGASLLGCLLRDRFLEKCSINQ